MVDRNNGRGSWRMRRRFMFAVAAFCMWTVAYCLYHRLAGAVPEAAVTMAFFTLGGIIGSYVFGATWEDITTAKARSKGEQ